VGHDADLGDDKPTPDELTKTPLVNGYGYSLWNELTKLQRSNNNNNNVAISRHGEITKTLLDIYSSPKARLIATLIWELKAFTTKELMKLTGFSSRVIDYTRNNLIRIGLLRKTIELNRPSGKRGPKPWIYAIGIADKNDSIEARLRYEEIVKQEDRKLKSIKREELRKTAEERRLKADEKTRIKGSLIQTLVTEFTGIYEKTKKPVSFKEITQRVKSVGLHDDYAYLDVAVKLEEKGIQTGYYVNGELDPNWEPPPEIRRVREKREVEL